MKLKEYLPSIYNSLRLRAIGVNNLKKKSDQTVPIFVTLTTIPSRLPIVEKTIMSVLRATPQPERITLWLHEDLKDVLPQALEKLQGDVFEIKYSPYKFSHRKLIHSLELYPNKLLVTIDDDMIYRPFLFGFLYKSHLEFPNDIIANRMRKISYNSDGEVIPYLQWSHNTDPQLIDASMMPVGACGVLYPVGALDKRVTDVSLLQKISPKSDDLWFKTMSLLNGTSSRFAPYKEIDPIPIINSQKVALKKINNTLDYKRVQWEKIAEYFDLKDRVFSTQD